MQPRRRSRCTGHHLSRVENRYGLIEGRPADARTVAGSRCATVVQEVDREMSASSFPNVFRDRCRATMAAASCSSVVVNNSVHFRPCGSDGIVHDAPSATDVATGSRAAAVSNERVARRCESANSPWPRRVFARSRDRRVVTFASREQQVGVPGVSETDVSDATDAHAAAAASAAPTAIPPAGTARDRRRADTAPDAGHTLRPPRRPRPPRPAVRRS